MNIQTEGSKIVRRQRYERSNILVQTTGARERETLAPIAASCATQNHGRALLFYQQESFFSWRDVLQPN